MENEGWRRGRSASRASSTSSSLEVRCACQYFKSDSLLPERSALAAANQRPRRMVQTPPAHRRPPLICGDHEYEPIGPQAMRYTLSQHSVAVRMVAPVVKITDTDVVPVADSDDSIDDRHRFASRALVLEGDVILPLDGRIEDNAMDGRNLGDQTIDTSADELDGPAEAQDGLERSFVAPAALAQQQPAQQQQVQDSTPREQPDQPAGLQQRLKSQAGRIRSRLKSIQKPTFSMPRKRAKSKEKPSVTTKTEETTRPTTPPASPRSDQVRASRMERFRMALPERPRFHLPDKSKFHLPDKSKFHLPECPKLNLPDRSKFHIKKPNIHLPKSFSRPKRTPSQRSVPSQDQSETPESKTSPKRNIFDFSTYPRPKMFDRKPKKEKVEYVTSSPKESRAQSTESSTFPRVKKSSMSLSARWAQRFGETVRGFHEDSGTPVDRSTPWRHPSLEEPRLSLRPQTSIEKDDEEEEKMPWENTERRTYDAEDEVLPIEEDVPYKDKESKLSSEKEADKDPGLQEDIIIKRIETQEEPKKRVRMVEDDNSSMVDQEVEDEHHTYHPSYPSSFPPVDPRQFQIKTNSVELSEGEESMRSDREIQQSSGSSCERRRRGVIEELDSDEFFLREKGISQENMRFHLASEIRDALSERNAQADDEPPVRPQRLRSMRKRKDASFESFEHSPSPEQQHFERGGSLQRHRIVYQTEAPVTYDNDDQLSEPLDDIVVVKPERRKSKSSSITSHSQNRLPPEEQNIVLAPIHPKPSTMQTEAPPIPYRRKRLKRDQSSSFSIRTVDSALYNGYDEAGSHERIPPTPPPTPPPLTHDYREDELDYIEPAIPLPVPPKRTRSHSRTASLAPEDDRTSHGAESLPGDFGEEDFPRDFSSTSREPSLPGYAVIEKREKPPRPPPPRRKKQDKFATAPRPAKTGPKRPIKPYSTLRPSKSDTIRKSTESMPFIDADYSLDHEEDFHKDLRSGEVLSRMQGRPLPAPPRPPRQQRRPHRSTPIRRSLPREITPDFSETVASTQTDPLPDDFVIEEEIMAAKLVMAPSRSGSAQVLISTERLPSPTSGSYKSLTNTPPIPPLPSGTQQRDTHRIRGFDTGESDARMSPLDQQRQITQSQIEMLRSAIFSTEEPLRISSLEVGDLKVDRLTVSQLEAYKVAASEIDAIVVSATEMSNRSEPEGGIHPSLLQELIAIRNQLEAVAASQPQSRPQSAMEDASTATSNERIDAAIDELRRKPITRPLTRESSPLLIVQPSVAEQEATTERGRTVYPLSTSMTDLTSASDSVTVSSPTIIAVETSEEPVIIIEPVLEASTTMTATTTGESTRSVSRSRSASPSRAHPGAVRQTASPFLDSQAPANKQPPPRTRLDE